MGGTQSVEKAQKKIGGLHSDIDGLVDKIQKEGDDVVQYIIKMDYDKRDELCQKLEYHYVDILKSQFPIKVLTGVELAQGTGNRRVQLGMKLPEDILTDLTLDKTQICQNIVDLFKTKIEIIGKLQKAVPDCKVRERKIYENLSAKMKAESSINTEKWGDAYKRMTKFNKDIKSSYTKIYNMIDAVLNAKTKKQVDSLHKKAVGLIARTSQMCERTIDIDLSTLRTKEIAGSDKPGEKEETKGNGTETPKVPAPPPKEEMRTVIALYDFDAGRGDELSIKKGDKLTFLEEDGQDWLRVRNSKKQEGLVPKIMLKRISRQ